MQPGGPRDREVWAGDTWVSLLGSVAWSWPPVLEFGEVERGQREVILGREWTTHRFLEDHPQVPLGRSIEDSMLPRGSDPSYTRCPKLRDPLPLTPPA